MPWKALVVRMPLILREDMPWDQAGIGGGGSIISL
jgi:hypothetical protein